MRYALSRIYSLLSNSYVGGRILMSQQLIDEAFLTDELADGWFKARGFRLIPVRI